MSSLASVSPLKSCQINEIIKLIVPDSPQHAGNNFTAKRPEARRSHTTALHRHALLINPRQILCPFHMLYLGFTPAYISAGKEEELGIKIAPHHGAGCKTLPVRSGSILGVSSPGSTTSASFRRRS